MGVIFLLKANGSEFETALPREDYQTLELLRPHLPGSVSVMIDETERSGEESILLEDMLGAVVLINAFLRDNPEFLPFTYEFKCQEVNFGGVVAGGIFSTGGVGGIRLPGDEENAYAIWAGLDKCEMWKSPIRSDGKRDLVERQDIRGLNELQTTSLHGVIEFRRLKSGANLLALLSEARAFLETLPEGSVVTRILC